MANKIKKRDISDEKISEFVHTTLCELKHREAKQKYNGYNSSLCCGTISRNLL